MFLCLQDFQQKFYKYISLKNCIQFHPNNLEHSQSQFYLQFFYNFFLHFKVGKNHMLSQLRKVFVYYL